MESAKALVEHLANLPGICARPAFKELIEHLPTLPQEVFMDILERVLIEALADATEKYKTVDPTLGRGVERTIKAPLIVVNKNEKTDK